MQEIKTYKTGDLVLTVTKTYDPSILDLTVWDRFLDVLCGDRIYQKEAIQQGVIFLASGKYNSIKDLIKDVFNSGINPEIKTRYKNIEEYYRYLQLPNKLSANIDLATGTGKSYVIYGIAQIMLGLGLVDKVLVLCPSLTIEKGLLEKFIHLTSDSKLRQTIPENSEYKNPRIIDANSTIKDGDICIENIHAVYEITGSSIQDSLKGVGERVLVLNDEAHHIYNKVAGRDSQSKSIKKWKEFLLNDDYNFKYTLGFTGTAYIDDEYFNDVIYRYSLRQAVDEQMVKMVDYVSKDDTIEESEKFQKIYDNHSQNRDNYRKLKPLTILITIDITNAKQLAEKLKEFLEKKEELPREEIDKRVLIVTSHKDHQANVAKLSTVDNKDDPVEWIVSVSMLTEGWDVKNVFQIVPWKDRAFNSKLLIAQVLGRGLRIPPEYQNPQPKVRVFNHDAWSRNIRGLVDEILEIEMKLISCVIKKGGRNKYSFDLYNINYDKDQIEKGSKREHKEFDYTKGYIELIAQVEESEKTTEYTNLSGKIRSKNTLIEYNTYTVDELTNKIFDEFKIREWEGQILKLPNGSYTLKEKLPPKDEIKKIILKSIEKRGIKGNRLVEKNKQAILKAFGTLLRKKGKTVVNIRKVTDPYPLSSQDIDRESLAVGNLRYKSGVFYSTNYLNETTDDNIDILKDLISKKEESLDSNYNLFEINEYYLKTPLDLIFVSHDPEFKFLQQIIKKENAEKIECWIKSRDQGFYKIDYSWRRGEHPKQNSFNPDFFIKISRDGFEYIIVVEIKSDDDDSPENKAKYKYSLQHFNDLNNELEKKSIKQKYLFHFLSPNSYTEFFQYLRDERLIKGKFGSDLEGKLKSGEYSL